MTELHWEAFVGGHGRVFCRKRAKLSNAKLFLCHSFRTEGGTVRQGAATQGGREEEGAIIVIERCFGDTACMNDGYILDHG